MFKKRLSSYDLPRLAGTTLLLSGLAISIIGFSLDKGNHSLQDFIRVFYANAGTELISIAITALVIDFLHERRHNQQLKQQLIRDIGSRSHEFALRAIADLKENDWLDEALPQAMLSSADLRGVDLSNHNLDNLNFTKALLRYARLNRASLRNSCLSYAILEKAELKGADLSHADLTEADLSGAIAQHANLSKACLYSAQLSHTDLSGAMLVSANLCHVDLTTVNLQNAYLKGVLYDAETVWPDGVNPQQLGARLVEKP